MNTAANPVQGLPISLIALTGKPGSGKDTCAQILADIGYQSTAFADTLRAEVAAAFRLDVPMLSHRHTKEWPLPSLALGMCGEPAFMAWAFDQGLSLHEPRSPRWAMQRWATWRRRYDPDYFVRPVRQWIRRQLGLGSTALVITDLRMPNEWAMLELLGASVIRISRPHGPELEGDTQSHESERDIPGLPEHAHIVNDACIGDLKDAILTCPLVLQHRQQVWAAHIQAVVS